MLHVKRTRAKGRTYLYFRTGQRDGRGREILAPLPLPKDPGFGDRYAALVAARSRRENARSSAAAELTVTAFCELYERSEHFRGLSAGSQRLYGISLRYFRKMLPTAPARELQRADIVRLVDGRADTPGAANSLLRAVNALYKWGRLRGHVENNPCRDIEELGVGEHEPWPEHIVTAALAAPDDRVRLAVHLLLFTAQRIGDVVQMKWTDINTATDGARRLIVKQQKTGRALEIPLHADLERELQRHKRELGYIIAGVQGRPLSQKTLRRDLQAFAAGLGTKIVPHGLRKNAVNALLEAGCSAAETAAISGQSLQMVEHYAKGRSQRKLGEAAILKWQGHRS
jgi:integrase